MFPSGDKFRKDGGWGGFRIQHGRKLRTTSPLVTLLVYLCLALASGVVGAVVVFGFMEGLVFIRNWYYYDVYHDPSKRMSWELTGGFVSGLVFTLGVIVRNRIDDWRLKAKNGKRAPEVDLDEEELERRVQTEILDKERKERMHE
jgi:hypothetical protein